MNTNSLGFTDFVRHLLRFTRWRAALIILSMVAVAFSEGLGLLLLVPLLALVTMSSDQGQSSQFSVAADYAARFDVELTLGTVIIVFVALVTVRQSMIYLSRRLVEETRIQYVNAIREDLFEAIGRTQWRVLKGGGFADIGQVLLMDGWRAGDAALNLFRSISTGIIIIVNAGVALLISTTLATYALAGIGFLMLVFGSRFRVSRARGERITAIQDEIYSVVENYLENLRVAKLSAAENLLQRQFTKTVEELGAEMGGFSRSTIAVGASLQLAAAIGMAGFVFVAVALFGTYGPELLVIIFITARLVPHFASLSQSLHHFSYHLPAFANAMSSMRACQSHKEARAVAIKVDRPQVSIAVDGVTVYAPDQSGKALLNDVSMELCIGEVVALQGPSGAGKSSLADVLSGLIYADHGEIRLDGTALTHEQILRWRQHVGYVPQSAALLRSTIRENLTWLLPSTPSDAEMDQVLSSTELGLLLESLPLGIETRIDRREGKLSGGERQRIALARELLRRPALLILDEATNALDLSTESKIFSNIRESYPSMSVLVIAHRPESLALADRVLDICDGKMICSDAVKSGGVVAVEIVGPVQGRRHA